MSARILLVEDDPTLRLAVRDRLRAEGFDVLEASDGEAGELLALREDPDLVLLDVMLPKKTGFSVLRALRADRFTAPVVLLTARGEELDRVQGFEVGADDYVIKPFSMQELVLRVRALLERARGGAPGVADTSPSPRHLRLGGVEVDLDAFQIHRDGAQHTLSRTERDLLAYFLRHEGTALERARIYTDVWGAEGETSTRTVDQHVAKLRKKLEHDPESPEWIRTVHGVGYLFTRRRGGS